MSKLLNDLRKRGGITIINIEDVVITVGGDRFRPAGVVTLDDLFTTIDDPVSPTGLDPHRVYRAPADWTPREPED